ncbi:hypothetical protein [Bacillus sp. CHD6a]|nr:hypothetical protein [Bacillus sp. CHD6a]
MAFVKRPDFRTTLVVEVCNPEQKTTSSMTFLTETAPIGMFKYVILFLS